MLNLFLDVIYFLQKGDFFNNTRMQGDRGIIPNDCNSPQRISGAFLYLHQIIMIPASYTAQPGFCTQWQSLPGSGH